MEPGEEDQARMARSKFGRIGEAASALGDGIFQPVRTLVRNAAT